MPEVMQNRMGGVLIAPRPKGHIDTSFATAQFILDDDLNAPQGHTNNGVHNLELIERANGNGFAVMQRKCWTDWNRADCHTALFGTCQAQDALDYFNALSVAMSVAIGKTPHPLPGFEVFYAINQKWSENPVADVEKVVLAVYSARQTEMVAAHGDDCGCPICDGERAEYLHITLDEFNALYPVDPLLVDPFADR